MFDEAGSSTAHASDEEPVSPGQPAEYLDAIGANSGLPWGEPETVEIEMAAVQTAVEDADASRSECWCCGMVQPPERMVNLSNHPEVALCLRCAHFVHQRAWEVEDQGRISHGARARDAWRRLRRTGFERGWHQRRWIGRPIRAIVRHLP